jgi:photosystem II stability/assembly factor-like uncharacterized protein
MEHPMNSYIMTKLFLIIAAVSLLSTAYPTGVSAQSADWVQIGPEGGMITSIEFDPVTPTTLYVTTEGGGVYKSVDGGEQWNAINTGLFGDVYTREQGMWTNDLVIDPNEPSTLYTIHHDGFFKSVDRGESWSLVSNPSGHFTSLAVDPVTPTTIYATQRDLAVIRSTDGGKTWWKLFRGDYPLYYIDKVETDPFVHNTVYAISYTGFFKSTDGGEDWDWLDISESICGVVALDPTTQDTLYASTCVWGDNEIAGIVKSVDGGKSWNQVAEGLGTDCMNGCKLVLLRADPTIPGTIYAGTIDGRIYKSTDGGESWQNISGVWPVQEVFSKITAIAISPEDSDQIFVGTPSGVFRSTDGGENWGAKNHGMNAHLITAMVIDPVDNSTLYVGTREAGAFKSTDGGTNWRSINRGASWFYITALAIDPEDTNTLYGGDVIGSFHKTTDGGDNWNMLRDGYRGGGLCCPTWGLEFLPSPASARTGAFALYEYGITGLSRTLDGANTWVFLDPDPNDSILALAVDPKTPSTLYALGSGPGYKSIDGGLTWHHLDQLPRPLYYRPPFAAVEIDPGTPTTLYVSGPYEDSPGGIYKSTDGGESWNLASAGIASPLVFDLAINPAQPSIIYAAAESGVYKSVNGGIDWYDIGRGMSDFIAVELQIDPIDPNVVYAATRGGGVLKSRQSDVQLYLPVIATYQP